MKKILSMMLAVMMIIGLCACSSSVAEPEDSVYKKDVQGYITEVLDETAEIDIFEKQSTEYDGDKIIVTCRAIYSGDAGENTGDFTLTYSLDGKEWKLDKCRVKLADVESNEDEDPTEETEGTKETEATEPAVEETTAAPNNAPSEVSDDWKQFTFELGGVMFQLPSHYSNFTAQGWKVDESRSDAGEETMISGYSRAYIYLTNGAVRFSAEVINMSGNARVMKDCDIGAISVTASNNLGLKLSGGIGSLSTAEEIQNAYGTPANLSTSADSTTLKYEAGDYSNMRFYIYNSNTTYNEITLRNFVATERDVTEAKDERPAYLDTYVAPTELGSDIKAPRFELDGVIYQLPCPLDAFTDNGWTVSNDSIGTLGAGNDEYGLTLTKDKNKIYLTMKNFAEYETYTRHCAVSAVSIEAYNIKSGDGNFAKLPGGVNMDSNVESVQELYKDFNRYDGSSSTSFTYENQDYTLKVRYAFYPEEGKANFEIKNEIWAY